LQKKKNDGRQKIKQPVAKTKHRRRGGFYKNNKVEIYNINVLIFVIKYWHFYKAKKKLRNLY